MLHFACARSHGRNALIQLIEDSGVSIAYRDELYRTARDVSMQATQPENTREIDKYVLTLAARGIIYRFPNQSIGAITILTIIFSFCVCVCSGELSAIKHLVIEGYDHIVDVHDNETIVNIAYSRGHEELGKYLESVSNFEVRISVSIFEVIF